MNAEEKLANFRPAHFSALRWGSFSNGNELPKPSNWMQRNKNVIGLTLCVLLFAGTFVVNKNAELFFNLSGLIIVLAGTAGATLISFRMERLAIVFQVLKGSYLRPVKKVDEIVEIMVDLSVKSRLKGLLALQEDEAETSILFLRRALGFLVDGYSPRQIQDLLHTEMYFFRLRREESERVLRAIGEMCPSFGLIGSVIGLIAMLAGVGDTSVILATVPIALTSTLYGILLANFFFIPFASNVRERTDHELLLQKVITEGVLAIASELHPRILEKKMKSFLTPSARNVQLVSLDRIREKFGLRSEGEDGKNENGKNRPPFSDVQ